MADHGNADTLTVIVTMTVKPDKEQDYLDFVEGVLSTVHREEPGVLLYAMHKHPDQPHTYVWVERYAHQAALDAHAQAPHMTEAFPKLGEFLAGPPEFLNLAQALPA